MYAVGGYDGSSRQCLSSVERYNPSDDSWCMVAEMSCRRSGAGINNLGVLVYIIELELKLQDSLGWLLLVFKILSKL